ncbi:hypothetical protein [Frigoriglobus tundricola]|uniref:DUF1570 domain-containing protein n=1 Tax=Frigoriglobus tundricola TaxID=2774151 RepID=A0A6M5YXZ4_9BACT|nr:hypothetical protein [Frigoriglobus tundricola]QJW98286.1 hypothetical protein FTUN_5874 [Frigoriglobus tundricola]
MRFVPVVPVCVLLAAAASGQPPAGLSNWPFDEITLKNGARFQGLILSEVPDGIEFRSVLRLSGRPTVTLTSFFGKGEIAGAKRLSKEDREALKEKLSELDPRGEGERKRMESLELVAAEWPGKAAGARRYDSDHFSLVCTGTEELTRRSAVRLEQIYTAFARFLPPTVRSARPTVLMLATDPDEYKTLLGRLNEAALLNPAVYDVATNRILCGTELKRLGDELQSARVHHGQQVAGLDRYEAGVRKLYKGDELARHLKSIAAERKRAFLADVNNGLKFDEATGRLFALLYHEAFHAYVGTFVYPPLKAQDVKAGKGTGELPRWLNEGLAQVFETAVVEAGELRADHPDGERLRLAKDWVRGKNGGSLVPLGDLLTIGRGAFLASHTDQKAASDRAYLTCWALAHYLTFDRRLIGTEAFRKYLIAVNSGGDPKPAFAALVGQDLTAFEKDWHAYLMRLQPDGTLTGLGPKS